jgi:hypothetical protein
MRMCLHLSLVHPYKTESELPQLKVTNSQESLHSTHCSALTWPLRICPSTTRELHDFSLTYGKFKILRDLFKIFSPHKVEFLIDYYQIIF